MRTVKPQIEQNEVLSLLASAHGWQAQNLRHLCAGNLSSVFAFQWHGRESIRDILGGWFDLFETSFLEWDVFWECYTRLMEYAPFNSPHRHFVHGDLHGWNLLSDGRSITGVIDPLGLYGDFIIDLVMAQDLLPQVPLIRAIQEEGLEISHIYERILGARYFKGLDGLRFYAKMGWRGSYDSLRDQLLGLVK